MSDIFSRTENLIGEQAVKKLTNAHVAVFGLGGVGSYVTEALARSGVGRLTLIDCDTVDISNINRQLFALQSTVGMAKTLAAEKRISDINPTCIVKTINKMYLPECNGEFFNDKYDYIVDAIDNVTAKIDLCLQAQSRSIPIIASMGTGNKLHPEMFEIADIYDTEVCPLCRVMRRELKKRAVKALKVVYSKEIPHAEKQTSDDCRRSIPASIAFVPGSAGLLIASEVIRELITEKPELI